MLFPQSLFKNHVPVNKVGEVAASFADPSLRSCALRYPLYGGSAPVTPPPPSQRCHGHPLPRIDTGFNHGLYHESHEPAV